MARILYPDLTRPDVLPLVERVKCERGGKVGNIFKMLMHSPPALNGFLDFFTAVRQQYSLDARYLELAIIQVALVNGAEYEVSQHVPLAIKAGITQDAVEALKRGDLHESLNAIDRAVLDYTDEMTRRVRVSDAVFARVRSHFDEGTVVELTLTIAGYNLVSRVLEALQIDHE
jgi:AhpD family alkylhydroperoxidase